MFMFCIMGHIVDVYKFTGPQINLGSGLPCWNRLDFNQFHSYNLQYLA